MDITAIASATINELIEDCTYTELEQIPSSDRPSPRDLERQLINAVRDACAICNQFRAKNDKLIAPKKLTPPQITAIIMITVRNFVLTNCLAVYAGSRP